MHAGIGFVIERFIVDVNQCGLSAAAVARSVLGGQRGGAACTSTLNIRHSVAADLRGEIASGTPCKAGYASLCFAPWRAV